MGIEFPTLQVSQSEAHKEVPVHATEAREGLETVASFSYFRSVIMGSVFDVKGDDAGENVFFFHPKLSSNICGIQLNSSNGFAKVLVINRFP